MSTMVPRTVQAAKAIADIITSSGVDEYGNVIDKTYRGWSNLYSSYYLGGLGDTLGNPIMHSLRVNRWDSDGNPRWFQAPSRKFDSGYGGIMYPNQDTPDAPPVNEVYTPG